MRKHFVAVALEEELESLYASAEGNTAFVCKLRDLVSIRTCLWSRGIHGLRKSRGKSPAEADAKVKGTFTQKDQTKNFKHKTQLYRLPGIVS